MVGVVVAVSFFGAPSPTPPILGRDARRESVWRGLTDEDDYLVLLAFPDERAAQDDLRGLIEGGDPDAQSGINLPTEVHHIAIGHQRGMVLDAVPEGASLGVARSTANPGYGPEARERLDDTLATFAQLPAYCGHLSGFNESVEEESWGFVFGTSSTGVPTPQNSDISIRLYRRVA